MVAGDSGSVYYVRYDQPARPMYRVPIVGGAPTRVTHFTGGDPITAHAWSPDGKLLAMVRSVTARDVVVIRDLRQ